jgi:hypothetical protein
VYDLDFFGVANSQVVMYNLDFFGVANLEVEKGLLKFFSCQLSTQLVGDRKNLIDI